MKTIRFTGIILLAVTLFAGCTDEILTGKGTIRFQCYNPSAISSNSPMLKVKSVFENPPLTGSTTQALMTSLRWTIGDVWVSKGIVEVGGKDDLEWIRLTDTTNTSMKLFEEYSFPPKEIPAGEYRSIKITFRNIFYRQLKLASDHKVVYELLETMGSWNDPCNPNDTTWAKTNYFSEGGNHFLDSAGVFQLASEGEKIAGFKIGSGKITGIIWRLGAGSTDNCTITLLDKNGNRAWDCGIDDMEIECPPTVKYMWDFQVAYMVVTPN